VLEMYLQSEFRQSRWVGKNDCRKRHVEHFECQPFIPIHRDFDSVIFDCPDPPSLSTTPTVVPWTSASLRWFCINSMDTAKPCRSAKCTSGDRVLRVVSSLVPMPTQVVPNGVHR
jgi:hypothetical protein